jgi:uncharacterized protein YdbL (DUF1318 family)
MKFVLKIAMIGLSAAILGAGALSLTPHSANTAYAQAQSAKTIVDAAKSAGKVGETAAGYLEAVNGQSLDAATAAAMREVNIGRKAVYTRLARDQGVKTEVVAALTGEKQIEKAARGEFVLKASGWQKK